MANSFQDISQMLLTLKDTIKPQSLLTGVTNGDWIDVRGVGTNRINAQLSVGAAVALTSLDGKIQAATDSGGTGAVDIPNATFTQVTAGNADPQTIDFQLPASLTDSSLPYTHIRAVMTVVGTSVLGSVGLLATRRYDQRVAQSNTPPTIN